MKRMVSFGCLLLTVAFLFNISAFAVEPIDVNASAALLIDPENGDVIYEKNSTSKAFPASITKLMTALLVMENVDDLQADVTASKAAFADLSDAGSSVGIKAGETMSVDNMLICLMVASANEAANILAEYVSGSVSAFVELMNTRATELGLTNTHFVNTHGLHDEEHYTCAKDISIIAREAQKHPRLVEIYQMEKATIPATNMSEERLFFSTNSLISPYKERTYLYKYATGIKTGHTTPAGLCLVSSAEKGELSFISVILGAEKDPETNKKGNFTETSKLLQWGFDNFKRKDILDVSSPIAEVKLELAWDRDHMIVAPASQLNCIVPNDFNPDEVVLTPELPESIDAPITKGDVIGKLNITYKDRTLGNIDLIASDTVKRSNILLVFRSISDVFSSLIVKIIFVIVLIALAIYLFLYSFNRQKYTRRRHRRSSYRGKRR